MNPLATLDATAKLIITGIAVVLLALAGWWLSGFFTAKAQLKEIRKTDARIERAQRATDAQAKARDNAADAHATANQQQASALAKDLAHENAVFDTAAAAQYLRVLNDALRGAER